MTSRDRIVKALNFQEVDRIPVEGGIEGIFPSDVRCPEYKYGKGKSKGTIGEKGSWVDEWGCVWKAGEDGVKGEVKVSPLASWEAFDTFTPPWDVLREADLSRVNEQCESSDKFMMTFWDTAASPFQRMQFLRGTENLFMDLAYGDIEVFKLRDMVHEYYMKQLSMWADTEVDGIHLEDDWGAQRSLLISPKLWREFFKPLYKDYCDLAHSKGKYVIMHSDGYIMDIIPDLIEVGVNAVNAQLDCMNVEEIGSLYHGKMAFWGGFDRQYLLPFGTTEEIRREVRRIANAFFRFKRTGLIAQCFADKDAKAENVYALYDEWSRL